MNRNWQAEADGPSAPDDGWWASVMREDEAYALPSPTLTVAQMQDELYGSATRSATMPNLWETAHQLHNNDEAIELEVIGYNRGGVLVMFNTLQGFVPASHLLGLTALTSDEDRRQALAQKVGQRLRVKVIEYEPKQNRIVFSERAALAETGSRQQLLSRLAIGDVAEGVVTNVCDFGVFVDLGGLEGLIHVSEVSWGRVAHPRDVVHHNQRVRVSVLSIDREHNRVALSLKRLRPDPWATVEQRYIVGQVVDGTVTNVVNFGAFVCVEDGLEGLVHISELTDGHFLHPRNIVREGEQIRARITSIDGVGRRLGLSLRQLSDMSTFDD